MNNLARSLTFLFSIVPFASAAQVNPANPGGFNNTDPRSPAYNAGNNIPPPGSDTRPHWKDQWGAIATDAQMAKLGTIDGVSSRQKAEKMSLKECRSQGGKNCTIGVVYQNRCGVMVTGDGRLTLASATSLIEATADALRRCGNDTTNCGVYHSGCSLPIQVN